MHVVTTFTRTDRPGLEVLVDDLRRHAPGVVVRALSLDGSAPPTGVDMIDTGSAALPRATFDELRAALAPDEVRAVAVPLALAVAIRQGADRALYLSPDVGVYGPLERLAIAATPGLALVRRVVPAGMDDGHRPDALDVLDAGLVTASVVGATPASLPVLDRWARLTFAQWSRGVPICTTDLLLLLAANEPDAHLVDEPRHLDGWSWRPLETTEPVLVDFTGHRPDVPYRALADALEPARRALVDDGDLAEIYAERDARVVAVTDTTAIVDDRVVLVGPSIPYDATMQRVYAAALRDHLADGAERPPSPFEAPDAFVAWCAAPLHDGPIPISRYVAGVRRGRADLLDAFPEVPGRNARDLVEWVRRHGRDEEHIPPALLPDEPPSDPVAAYHQPGVNLAGFLDAELGVGEVGRRLAGAMDAADVPYGTYTFARTTSRRRAAPPDDAELRYDTNLVCVNADSLGSFVQTVGPAFSAGRYRIGVWFWETADLPDIFRPAFGNLDELWAASDFVADALRAAAPPTLPVIRFPLPIVAPVVDPQATRSSLGLPEDRFLFVCSFDFLSVAERKNPFGVVDAFREAFAPGEGPVLVVKSINADKRRDDWDQLRWSASGRDDIVLRDGYLDAPANTALLALADCVVSLHRSEGFGFNLADAMALGTPVVATAWSGNLTFMSDDDCYLVPAAMTRVGAGHFPYDADSVWADPDLAAAARTLRSIVSDPGEASARAERARARVLADFSPERTGNFIRNRLAGIRASRLAASPEPGVAPTSLRRLASRVIPARRV